MNNGYSDVYVAIHRFNDTKHYNDTDTQILGIFTTAKLALKVTKVWKRNFGFRGKEAKLHQFVVESWSVCDKLSEHQLGGVKR